MDADLQESGFINKYFEYICTAPSMIFIFLIVGFPTFYLFWESLHVHRVLRSEYYFTGLGNFIRMFQSSDFLRYFGHTAVFTVGNVISAFVTALILAVALNRSLKYKSVFIGIILMPWTIPPVSSAVLWGWMFEKMYGFVNIILAKLGFQKIYWLGSATTSMALMILADAWIRVPLAVLILYAGLQRVPQDLIDAARVDGANAWQSFWKVTVNFIRPEISMVLVLLTMFAWREFSLPWTLTGGGPLDYTEIFGMTIYKQANLQLRYGYAAAIGVFVLLLTIVIAYYMFKIRKTEMR